MGDASAADVSAALYLQQLFDQFKLAHMIFAAARLGIADLLKAGPLPVADLAQATGTHERSLRRLLGTLASQGIFSEDASGRFSLNLMADPLRRDAPDSVRTQALFFGSEADLQTWADLAYSVRTGKPALEYIYGRGLFEYLHGHPELAQIFNDMMSGRSKADGDSIVAAHDFTQYQKVVDVGGGHGVMLALILDQSPNSHGVLFDSAQVIANAAGAIDLHLAQGRAEKVAGDFFEAVPDGGDAYVLKFILHDWDDESAITILRNCRQAAAPDGRVLIVEMVIPPGNEPAPDKMMMDMTMLLYFHSRERTEAEYRDLLLQAGLELVRTTSTASLFSIIEAVPCSTGSVEHRSN